MDGPRTVTMRPAIPVSLFAIPVGILGLAGAWNVGVRIWKLPSFVVAALEISGAVIWLTLVLLYAYKWYWHRTAALHEAQDPVNPRSYRWD